MSKNKFYILICALIIISGCAPKVVGSFKNKNYHELDKSTIVNVFDINEEIPPNSEYIGDVKVGDSGFTLDCGYNKVMNTAKELARKSGANILKITQIKEPSPLGSTCYRMRGKIYRNLDSLDLNAANNKIELKNRSTLPENAEYAIIHFTDHQVITVLY
jgi:hypothetical protein